MANQNKQKNVSCRGCKSGDKEELAFTMAFQPLVDVNAHKVYGYEALVRGTQGQGAHTVLSRVTEGNVYRFDRSCRNRAVEMATQLHCSTQLNINLMPGAIIEPETCIRSTVLAAERFGFPINKITFELVETEALADAKHLIDIVRCYRSLGFKIALDDFGNGYSNLLLLTQIQPDYLKLDRFLIHDIHLSKRRQIIVKQIASLAADLGIELVAEGVEQIEERDYLAAVGVYLHQGYYYARPQVSTLPPVLEWAM